jgi:predicted lysophospholipase L1 biosynthesis ABC-type transport system permease subunit
MRFEVKDTLRKMRSNQGFKRSLRTALPLKRWSRSPAGGVFIVAFALLFGASNLIIGLVAAIPPLAQLMQIPAIYLMEKYRTRRMICAYMVILSRSFWVLIALIPFFFIGKPGLSLLIHRRAHLLRRLWRGEQQQLELLDA